MTLRRALALAVAIMLVGGVASGQTSKEVYRARGTDTVIQTFPCIGEIQAKFNWQEAITESTDGSGGYHYQWRGSLSQLTAIDADGNEYSGSQTWNITYHVGSNEAFPVQDMDVEKINLLSRGRGPNIVMKIRNHITINARGEVRVERSLDTWECTGR